MNASMQRLLYLTGAVTTFAVVAPLRAQPGVATLPSAEVPRLRELVCRGGPSGLTLEVVDDPENPTLPGYVRMKLSFEAHKRRPAGSCHWLDWSDNPSPPPGKVFFDIVARTEEVEGVAKDTTVDAALAYIDTVSIRRYMSVPNHLWIFYQMHPSPENFAEVHGPADPKVLGITLAPSGPTNVGATASSAAGTTTLAAGRDGTSTVSSAGKGNTTANAAKGTSTLAKSREQTAVTANAPAQTSAGASSVNKRRPPVVSSAPKSSGTSSVKDARTSATISSTSAAAAMKRSPGAPGHTVALPRSPLTLVTIRPATDRFEIRFTARPNASPSVFFGTQRPVRNASTGRFDFPTSDGQQPLHGVGTIVVQGGLMRSSSAAEVRERVVNKSTSSYTASAHWPSERFGKIYYYIITVPAGRDLLGIEVPEEQLSGRIAAAQ